MRLPTVKLHLYGKHEPREKRKMGHLSATAKDPAEAVRLVLRARGLAANDFFQPNNITDAMQRSL